MFIVGPAVYAWSDPGPGWLFPALWVWCAVCVAILLRERGFQRRSMWGVAGVRRELIPMLVRFAVLAGAVVAGVILSTPERAFDLPRRDPGLWAMIMVLYPLLSVYPQEVVFRAFFFERYRLLFGRGWRMIAASAVAFGFVHVIFESWVSVGMTTVGGVMFAFTYSRSRSTLAASIEHSLYGCLVFTVGLGSYFYAGAVR